MDTGAGHRKSCRIWPGLQTGYCLPKLMAYETSKNIVV